MAANSKKAATRPRAVVKRPVPAAEPVTMTLPPRAIETPLPALVPTPIVRPQQPLNVVPPAFERPRMVSLPPLEAERPATVGPRVRYNNKGRPISVEGGGDELAQQSALGRAQRDYKQPFSWKDFAKTAALGFLQGGLPGVAMNTVGYGLDQNTRKQMSMGGDMARTEGRIGELIGARKAALGDASAQATLANTQANLGLIQARTAKAKEPGKKDPVIGYEEFINPESGLKERWKTEDGKRVGYNAVAVKGADGQWASPNTKYSSDRKLADEQRAEERALKREERTEGRTIEREGRAAGRERTKDEIVREEEAVKVTAEKAALLRQATRLREQAEMNNRAAGEHLERARLSFEEEDQKFELGEAAKLKEAARRATEDAIKTETQAESKVVPRGTGSAPMKRGGRYVKPSRGVAERLQQLMQ